MQSKIQIDNSLAIREMVLAGVGLTRTPTFMVGPDIKAGRLQAILTDYKVLEISIFVLHPHREYLSPKVQAFIDFITREITDTPPWDAFRRT